MQYNNLEENDTLRDSLYSESPINRVDLDAPEREIFDANPDIAEYYSTNKTIDYHNDESWVVSQAERSVVVTSNNSYRRIGRCSDRLLNVICIQICLAIQLTAFIVAVFLASRANRARHSEEAICEQQFTSGQLIHLTTAGQNFTYLCVERSCCVASFLNKTSELIDRPLQSHIGGATCILNGQHFDYGGSYMIYKPFDKHLPLCNTDNGISSHKLLVGVLIAVLSGVCLLATVLVCVPRIFRNRS